MFADTLTYDPVFAAFGMEVYSNESADRIREHNINSNEIKLHHWIPQAGFQEQVLCNDADVLIIGGRRGGGKSAAMILAPLRYIQYPFFSCTGFRKEEPDIERGIWKASQPIYQDLGEAKQTDYSWKFKSGATIKYEHLQNEAEVDRRFRGVEIPFMEIDELPQIMLSTFFTLLASNRNSFGIRNQFIGTCNPVDEEHWLYKFIRWYIDEETGLIRQDRNGRKRYFYKYGETVEEIFWGNTKAEVYHKAKDYIDEIWDIRNEAAGLNKYSLINSLCFIEGEYSQNKIFIKKDPSYLGNLAQQGSLQSKKDLSGRWGGSRNTGAEIDAESYQKLFTNTEQRTGVKTAIADVALSRDQFIIGAFDGNHLFDVEVFTKVGSSTAAELCRKFLERHGIRESNFAFDADGIGAYLKEPFHVDAGGAIAFNNNSASTDNRVWYNLKAECADKYITAVRESRYSIAESVQNKVMPDGKTFREHLESQRRCLVRKDNNSNKYQLISKPEMKIILGGKKSPDETDMMLMHEIFKIKQIGTGEIKGLNYLRFM